LKAGPRHKENLAGIGKILRIPSKEKIFF